MPDVSEFANEDVVLAEWNRLLAFRNDVLKALETARTEKLIGKSLEAKVTVYPENELRKVLTSVTDNLAQILIVSGFIVSDSDAPADAQKFADCALVVEKADGVVCPRCRAVKTDVGSDVHFPELCGNCASIVEKEFPEAVTEGFEK